MSDLAITAATALLGADTASGDLFPVVDVSASTPKGRSITRDELGTAMVATSALTTALAAKLDKAGGTMTGALAVTPGTLATTGLRLAQTWNSAGTTCRGLEVAVTDTACASDSTIARFLGGAGGATPIFAVTKTGVEWFATSGHYAQMDNAVTLPRLRGGYSSSPRSAILFNAGGSGVSPLLLSTTGDCFFGRGTGLDNSPNVSTAFRGFAQSFSSLTFTFSATNKDEAGAYTGAGHNVEFVGGRGSAQGTGAAGGNASLIGGAAAGSGNNNGGNVTITGGAPTGSGTRGNVLITNLPTSSAGLPTGALWNNAGVLNIA